MSDLILNVRESIDRVLAGNASADDVLACLGIVAKLKELTRAIDGRAEAAAIDWIEKHGPIESGGVRYYVGPNRSVKCPDLGKVVDAILSRAGVDELVTCLSTGAFKPSAVRELLPADELDGLFVTTTTGELREGKPTKRLQKADERYGKGRAIGRAGDGAGEAGVGRPATAGE